jgi:hypothetical protein
MHLIVGLIFLACAVVVFLVVLRIGAAITRTAVRMTNGLLGGREIDEFDFRRGAGYNYDPIPRPKSLSGLRVPVPGVVYAVLINIAAACASAVAQVAAVLGLTGLLSVNTEVPDELSPEALGAHLAVAAAGLAAGVLANVFVLKLALPTTYLRAAVVLICQYVIVMLIGLVVVLGLFALTGLPDGGLPNARPTNQPVWFK